MGQPPLTASIDVAASPDVVWAALADLRRMSKRSPETVRMWISSAPGVGSRGLNLNRRKGFFWPTTTRITRWEPERELAFHVWPTDVEWSYELEPTPDGTRVVERRTALPKPSLSVRLTAKLALGGADPHDAELLAGMHATLAALKADAEATVGRPAA